VNCIASKNPLRPSYLSLMYMIKSKTRRVSRPSGDPPFWSFIAAPVFMRIPTSETIHDISHFKPSDGQTNTWIGGRYIETDV
jgi:hypothetical protein